MNKWYRMSVSSTQQQDCLPIIQLDIIHRRSLNQKRQKRPSHLVFQSDFDGIDADGLPQLRPFGFVQSRKFRVEDQLEHSQDLKTQKLDFQNLTNSGNLHLDAAPFSTTPISFVRWLA